MFRLPLTAMLLALLASPPLAARSSPPAAAVASAHPLATEAGLEVLTAGGNAFDAAVAVGAALAVVEPYGSGLGGGGFWLLHRAEDSHEVMIDGRETAPAAASADMYLDDAGRPRPRASLDGPLAAGIPGIPASLDHLARRYGRLPLSTSLAPAIRLARQGFLVDEHYRRMAGFRQAALAGSPEAARLFLVDGEPPPVGHRLRQAELAVVLERLAATGRDGFYRGETARRLVEGVREGGGRWTLEDLAGYRVKERTPVVGHYRGIRIVSAPPPSSGGIALVTMLNVLAGYRDLDGVDGTHLIVEAMRRAYRDRAEYLGDPDFVELPTARLVSGDYAAGLRRSIHPRRALPSEWLAPALAAPAVGEHTTHLSVLDEAGNRVAATLTLNLPFGAAFVPPGTGVVLNNEMDDFAAAPGLPNAYGLIGSAANAIAPGKRPLSSMTPTFLESADRLAILGTPGGSRIISMVLLSTLDFADGAGPAAMAALPRFHHQYLPDEIQHEPGAFSPEQAAALAARGHRLRDVGRRYGDMQVVVWDRRTGRVEAASDPRGIGAARVRTTAAEAPAREGDTS